MYGGSINTLHLVIASAARSAAAICTYVCTLRILYVICACVLGWAIKIILYSTFFMSGVPFDFRILIINHKIRYIRISY